MLTDFYMNGHASGEVANALEGMQYDPGFKRPMQDNPRSDKYVVVNSKVWDSSKQEYRPVKVKKLCKELIDNGMFDPVWNATTTLRKEEWIELDRIVVRAARYRQRAWADLSAAASYTVPGMSKLSLEHETIADPGEALVDLDGLTEGRNDYPLFQLEALPLPITHSDFWFSSRKLAVSRSTGTPLDSTMAEAAARRVAETVEKTTIGTLTGITYGPGTNSPSVGRTSAVYGYTNFTSRLTYTGTAPTGSNASTILANVLAMKDTLTANKFYGPFMIYHSNDWDQYLDNDYILSGGNVATQTLRNRLRSIEGVVDVRRLDQLFSATPKAASASAGARTLDNTYPFAMIMVQLTPEVARAVNGMDITTVQWESVGGMRLNFKVMCIQVPQLRADFYGNCGILHATFS